MKFDEILEIDEKKLTKKYIESLSKQERLDLIDPIFNLLRTTDFIYPDDEVKIKKSWKRLQEYVPDLDSPDLFNNSSLATDICKHFCHTFYQATETGKPTLIDNFKNDAVLKKIIHNRLGLGWLDPDDRGPGVNEAFNLSFKMIVFQGGRSMRLVNATSIFKPSIAKYICMKYSSPGDTVGDYSCGFGGRMMGAVSCGRKYIGTDPLTVPELERMVDFFKFPDCTLIHSGSENYRGKENSVDLYWSSPPYQDMESYSNDPTQAYNNGTDHFYDVYWKQTLANVRFMLKPGKVFGLNVMSRYDRMIEMAREQFGNPVEEIRLRTIRSHLGKNLSKGIDGIQKYEPVFIFKNNK